MIKARHHWFYVRFFRFYTRWMLARHFRRVILKGQFQDTGRPVLLVGNHFSWWDGFFAHCLNEKLFHKRFHVMMLEQQLRPRMFLNKAGAFSIRKHSPSVLESLHYTRRLLEDPHNLVAMFPQGKIHSMYDYPVKFEKGPVKILRGIEPQVRVFFMAALVDYFSHPKPSLTLAIEEYQPTDSIALEDMEEAFNHFLRRMIQDQHE